MKMKKACLFFAALLAASFVVSGCGSSGGNKAPADTSTAEISDQAPAQTEGEASSDSGAAMTQTDAAEEEAPVVSISKVSDGNWEYVNDGETLAMQTTYEMFEVSGASDVIEGIFDTINNDQISAEESFRDANLEDAKTIVGNGEADYLGYYTHESELYCERMDDKVVSVLSQTYMFMMGAHGGTAYYTYNYDAQTGEEITKDDLFTDQSMLADALAGLLLDKYPAETFFSGEDVADDIQYTLDEGILTYLIGAKGVSVIFGEYEIAPYAAGIQTVTIPWDSELVNQQYAPENMDAYIIPIYSGRAVDVESLDDSLSVSWYALEDDPSLSFTYILGEDYDTMKEVQYANMYFADAYLAHVGGNDYLLLNFTTDNDYEMMYTFEITEDMKFKLKNGTRVSDPYDFGLYANIPVSTSGFEMQMRTDLMGTINVGARFTINADGSVQRNDAMLYVPEDTEREFTCKQDIELEVLADSDAQSGQMQTFAAGTKLYYYRTDGISIVDLKTEDGTIVRLRLSEDEYESVNQYNGQNVEELFDGVFYAG